MMALLAGSSAANPLVPTAVDYAYGGLALLAVILACAALVSLVRGPAVRGWAGVLTALGIIAFPIVGPLTWLVLQRRARRAR